MELEEIYSKGFITTAAPYHDYFHDFGVNEKSANLYGVKVEDIVSVICTISENQDIHEKEQEYWGWYDNEDKKLCIIFPSCFIYRYKVEENKGKGKAFKLKVKRYE